MPSFSSTLKKELVSLRFFLITLFVGGIYLCISVVLLNIHLFTALIAAHEQFGKLLVLFVSLLTGLWSSLSINDFFLTLVTALLVGVNISLLLQTIYLLEHKGKVKLSIGGATVIGLIASGCTSCGLSLISILGLSTSLSFLPFHGMELHIGAVILLLLSGYYMLRQLHNSLYCKIPVRT